MEIVLHGDTIKSEQDFHRILSEKLEFGPYYGANLAALWDRLTTDVERPLRLIWKDSAASRSAMGEELFVKIIKIIRDVEQQDRDLGLSNKFILNLE